VDLTLVIPCFNEARRVDACLAAATAYLDGLGAIGGHGGRGEIVVVDDGSTDGTGARVAAFAARRPDVRLVALDANQGKGAAVRAGVLAARGDVVVFLDADLAVDVGHVDRVLGPLRNGVDVAVGCRHVPGASVTQPQGVLRRTLGRGYLGCARAAADPRRGRDVRVRASSAASRWISSARRDAGGGGSTRRCCTSPRRPGTRSRRCP
jgi:dolichyl-phosphate beta-glucosyltransferase